MLEFASAGTGDCTSFEKGVSNVKLQGTSWKATNSETFKETDYVKTNDQL